MRHLLSFQAELTQLCRSSHIMCSCPLTISVALCNFRWNWSHESLLLLLLFSVCRVKKLAVQIWTHSAEYKDTCGDLTCKRNNISQFYKLLVTKAKTATTCLCGICLESIKDEEIHVVSIQFFQMFCSASLSNWEGTIERERVGCKESQWFPRCKVLLYAYSMANL